VRGLEWASDGNPKTRSSALHQAACHVRTALDAWGTRVAAPCQATKNEGKEQDSGSSGEQSDTPAATPPHTSLLRRASAMPAPGGESPSVGGGAGLPSHAAGERVVLGGGGGSESSGRSSWLESVTWALQPSSSWQVLLPRH
jgi:hypothetical protein